ncbi:NADPH oxidase organizer 1a [Cololabis saira]|uniref:NADPH oxidase organizer 1a n=1 Tax=Cololabis saira TaxID=129043 RepID=UPI002AD3E1AB|nr:NADPH oxidase organizer 1a [Cololabis saira]
MEAERYPISVSLVGVLHKGKSKMYICSVLWSDQNEILVYRSFKEFRIMHKQIKKIFPSASRMKKSEDRILPKFQANKMRRKSRGKGTAKALVRLKFLQKYCNELLSSDPRVPQSADLIKFFHPKVQELEPDFTKNSIMIMPSDDELKSSGGHGNSGNVTHPFVTETYRCVAPYETKDTKNKPFKVAVDEKVDVLIKDKAGWWLVEKEDRRMAWFPAPYLEKLEDDEDEDEMDGTPERGMMYTAVKSYKSTKDDEISVNIGVAVEVLQQSNNGWWLIRHGGKVGYIPSMYLKPCSYPHIRRTSQHQDLLSSSTLNLPSLSLQEQSHHSRSQGNLLEIRPVRSSSLIPLDAEKIRRFRSWNELSEQPHARPAGSTADSMTTKPAPVQQGPPPAIMVEMDEEDSGRNLTADSGDSFGSDSISDEFSSSDTGSSLNLTASEDGLRLSRTPPPKAVDHLSPTSYQEGRLLPSVSDPNLYKGPKTPTVPPRPRPQDILARCGTVTRKKAARRAQSPTKTEISSH